MENKPFVFGVAASGDNFTDRESETARLLMNFRSGVNTVLISPRRWGKTSLVRKVCRLAQTDELKIVYLDIFSCRSDADFYDAFASAVLKQTSTKVEEWMENIRQFLSRISPKISLGADPAADFSFSLELTPKREDIDEILQLPEKIAEKKGCRIVVCIDEFQQIGEFKDSKTFQKRLRSVWQLQKHVSYCLFGSKKHLMNELFERKSLPFYKFGDAIYLQKSSLPTGLATSAAASRQRERAYRRSLRRRYAAGLTTTRHTCSSWRGSCGRAPARKPPGRSLKPPSKTSSTRTRRCSRSRPKALHPSR